MGTFIPWSDQPTPDTMSTAAESKPKEDIRDELVVTAVKFLQNSKVVGSSIETKKSFLMNKGLTSAEIEAAFSRLGSVAMVPASPQGLHQAPQMLLAQPSFSSRIRDLLNVLLLIGGFSYGIRYLWKNYIQAWLFGPVQEEKSPHDKLMETSSVILTALESFKNTILGLESSIEKYSAKLDQVTDQMKQVSTEESYGKQDLKAEIQSVKGILLSSRSFPGHSRTTLSSPSIPSWQLKTEIAEDEDEQDLDTEVKPADTPDLTKTHSSNVSSSSEIEMINETSGEENQ